MFCRQSEVVDTALMSRLWNLGTCEQAAAGTHGPTWSSWKMSAGQGCSWQATCMEAPPTFQNSGRRPTFSSLRKPELPKQSTLGRQSRGRNCRREIHPKSAQRHFRLPLIPRDRYPFLKLRHPLIHSSSLPPWTFDFIFSVSNLSTGTAEKLSLRWLRFRNPLINRLPCDSPRERLAPTGQDGPECFLHYRRRYDKSRNSASHVWK